MAWQLIYTSAPRLLQAGRTGFGTVARHQALSPLLVSAIERASQFSRLPGVDADRVIYSHRIITVAGSKFHVLSAIRDAGADYTGRTNHIAHHLVADLQEIRQVGAHGPSPAEVLLSFPWVTSWDDSPRYLEASEEVALSGYHSAAAVHGSAWAKLPGTPEQAALLVSGETLRGAYVIHRPSVDLRAIYRESLDLLENGQWQQTLTTSLQSSDEPADFRWIGLEEYSPLRWQAEAQHRTVLDLTRPETLPTVEAPAPPPARPAAGDVAGSRVAGQRTGTAIAEQVSQTPELARTVDPMDWDVGKVRRAGVGSGKWILAGAVALVLLLAAAGLFVVRPLLQKREQAEKLSERLASSQYFDQETSKRVAAALLGKGDDARAERLITASNRLVQMLESGHVESLESDQTQRDLEALANSDGRGLPPELGALRGVVEIARRAYRPPGKRPSQDDPKALSSEFASQQDEITQLRPLTKEHPHLHRMITALNAYAEQQKASGLLALVEAVNPTTRNEKFSEEIDSLEAGVEDADARAKFAQTRKRWKELGANEVAAMTASTSRPHPAPVTPSVKLEPTVPPAVPAPTLPIYFVVGKEALAKRQIEGLRPELNFSWRQGVQGPFEKLKDLDSGRQLVLRTNAVFDLRQAEAATGSGKPFFLIPTEDAPPPPFCLSAHDVGGAEVFQIWVLKTAKDSAVPPPAKTSGLTRKQSQLQISPQALELPGIPQGQLTLSLPDKCAVNGQAPMLAVKADWSVDLAEPIKQAEGAKQPLLAKITEIERALAQPAPEPVNEYPAKKDELLRVAGVDIKTHASEIAALKTPVGECLKWIQIISQSADSKAYDALLTFAGAAKEPAAADGANQAAMLEEALLQVKKAQQTLAKSTADELRDIADKAHSQKELAAAKLKQEAVGTKKLKNEKILLAMEKTVMALRGETAAAKSERAAKRTRPETDLADSKKKLNELDSHPLLLAPVPLGKYTLSVTDAGQTIPLVEIDIQK